MRRIGTKLRRPKHVFIKTYANHSQQLSRKYYYVKIIAIQVPILEKLESHLLSSKYTTHSLSIVRLYTVPSHSTSSLRALHITNYDAKRTPTPSTQNRSTYNKYTCYFAGCSFPFYYRNTIRIFMMLIVLCGETHSYSLTQIGFLETELVKLYRSYSAPST